jgi:hypothetical protein
MGDLASWLKRLIGIEDPMAAFLREGKHAKEMLEASGEEVPNVRAELRKATANAKAWGVLKLNKIDSFRNEKGLVDPAVHIPASEATARYRDAMWKALSIKALDDQDAAPRDGDIFAARRALIASMPVPLTPAMVLEMDRVLGLPPIDPIFGFPEPATAESRMQDAEWWDLRRVLLRNPNLTPENVDFDKPSILWRWRLRHELPTNDMDLLRTFGAHLQAIRSSPDDPLNQPPPRIQTAAEKMTDSEWQEAVAEQAEMMGLDPDKCRQKPGFGIAPPPGGPEFR